MVQYSDGLDPIEGAAKRCQIQNVGLRIFDAAQTELAGFPSRVSEAWQTEVNRKHARIGKNLRHKHRVLSGTAAGD